MTMLRTIHEEPEPQRSQTLVPKPPPSETELNANSSQSSSLLPDSLQPVKEQMEMDGSGSDWDDETSSWVSGEENKKDSHAAQPDEEEAEDPPVHPTAQLYRKYQLHTPRSPRSSAMCHQSFLERIGRILCNHSAAIDTSDDTSVIVEIASSNHHSVTSTTNGHDDPSTYMTSEERKRKSLKRSQEEYLLNVILEQKQQLNKLW